MGRIYLLRHTRPAIAQGLCYGRSDVPLAPSYAEELELLSQAMPPIDRIYSSPLGRCRRLAEDLASRVSVPAPVCLEPALLELDFGAWEGRLWSEIPRHESDPWAEDFIERAPPGGESYRDLVRRVCLFLRTLSWTTENNLLMVTHSGVIRALRSWEQQISLAKAFDEDLPYGSLCEITRLPSRGAAIAECQFL